MLLGLHVEFICINFVDIWPPYRKWFPYLGLNWAKIGRGSDDCLHRNVRWEHDSLTLAK